MEFADVLSRFEVGSEDSFEPSVEYVPEPQPKDDHYDPVGTANPNEFYRHISIFKLYGYAKKLARVRKENEARLRRCRAHPAPEFDESGDNPFARKRTRPKRFSVRKTNVQCEGPAPGKAEQKVQLPAAESDIPPCDGKKQRWISHDRMNLFQQQVLAVCQNILEDTEGEESAEAKNQTAKKVLKQAKFKFNSNEMAIEDIPAALEQEFCTKKEGKIEAISESDEKVKTLSESSDKEDKPKKKRKDSNEEDEKPKKKRKHSDEKDEKPKKKRKDRREK